MCKVLNVSECSPSAANRLSAEARMLTSKVLAHLLQQKEVLMHILFSGRAAAANAHILFDTGASTNFVSKVFAKQTGITVRPVKYSVRFAYNKTTEVAGEATLYVCWESFTMCDVLCDEHAVQNCSYT
jgi:spermidine/putrescine-binding protein